MSETKLRVAICTAVWKRPEIFEMFAKGIHNLIKNCPDIEFEVIVAGSEGQKSKSMVLKHEFWYLEIVNDPLSIKMNSTVMLAKTLNVDYILGVGSDDVITPELMYLYKESMENRVDYIGVLDFYFYDTTSGKSSYWGGYREAYRKGHTCGAGRLISKRLLNLWNWQPWEARHSKILDTSIQEKLKHTPHTTKVFSLKQNNVYALDIKSSTNMTPFELWDNTIHIDTEIIKMKFPYIFE